MDEMLAFILFIKEMLINKEIAPMFVIVFIILTAVFKDGKHVAKALRTQLVLYTLLITIITQIKS